MIALLLGLAETPAIEPVEYLIEPAHLSALHHCMHAIEDRIEGFGADFHDGGWWVSVREDEAGAWIAFIPYDPETGMQGGDMTCEFVPDTGDVVGDVMFGR